LLILVRKNKNFSVSFSGANQLNAAIEQMPKENYNATLTNVTPPKSLNVSENRTSQTTTRFYFLAYCSVSPLNSPAADRAIHFTNRQREVGRGMLFEYVGDEHIANRFHNNFGQLLKTSPDNISMVTNTSEAISMIANGYPFEPGDQIVSYINEYPANHYPWMNSNPSSLIGLGSSQSATFNLPVALQRT